jgi:hypothetical protein
MNFLRDGVSSLSFASIACVPWGAVEIWLGMV